MASIVSVASAAPLEWRVIAMLALGLALLAAAVRLRHRNRHQRHKRGALVRAAPPWCTALRGVLLPGRARLRFAGIPLEPRDETRHFKLIGATGAGKSTAIQALLAQALERGDHALFADPDGGYTDRLYRKFRGDVILNPFESGSARWDLFAELEEPFDAEELAASLIATGLDPAASEWRSYARTFLSALLRCVWRAGRRDAPELWRLLSRAPIEELRAVLQGTPAQPFLEPDNARMFGSIRSIAVAALAALDHLAGQRGTSFSVRAWVAGGGARGCLFLPYRARQIAALRTLIATWVRLAVFEALSGREGVDQRLWFVVDELDALGPIEGLKDALARLRKFGGRCVLGFQSIAQVSGTYGHSDAQTIVENCGNTLILRCSSSEQGGTSQFASRLIGDREVLRCQVTRQDGARALLSGSAPSRSRQMSDQQLIEPAVLASEIERLPDLEGYFKRAHADHWRRVRIRAPAGGL